MGKVIRGMAIVFLITAVATSLSGNTETGMWFLVCWVGMNVLALQGEMK